MGDHEYGAGARVFGGSKPPPYGANLVGMGLWSIRKENRK